MRWNSTQLLTDTTLIAEQVKTSGGHPLPSRSVKPTTPVISPLNTRILAVKASIKRPYADKYTSKSITSPLLPKERGALDFIDTTTGSQSYDHWMRWARDTQPENDGDHLILALLRLDYEFINSLSARLFGHIAFAGGQWSYGQMNRAGLEVLAASVWRKGTHIIDFERRPNATFPRRLCRDCLYSLILFVDRRYLRSLAHQQEQDRLHRLIR